MYRILLLLPTRTYRARAFMRAAKRLGAEVTVGSERRSVLERSTPGATMKLDLRHPERAVEQIAAFHDEFPLDTIVGVDDRTALLAAMAAARLGLPHNDVDAVRATNDKYLMRRLLAEAEAPSPWFRLVPLAEDPAAVAADVPYPCVVKPVALSASRGVIRADDPASFVAAVGRLRAILEEPETAAALGEDAGHYLIEGFIPGVEVALEGMVVNGRLNVLAIFDKPDPLDGPFFEETIYVTPSRLSAADQTRVIRATEEAAEALGLTEGPLHAELRLNDDGAFVVEIAARTIGGLCSSVLEFGGGRSLEDLVLLHAVGADVASFGREPQPAGVMMIPIPRRGVLRAVEGIEAARAVPGVTEVTISIPLGDEVLPAPEGDRYLGFIFARGQTTAHAEAALREAHARLYFEIEPTLAIPGEPMQTPRHARDVARPRDTDRAEAGMDLVETLARINELSVDQRIELVQAIWDGIADERAMPPLTDAQVREIERRVAEHEANPDDVIPWEEVNARLRDRFADEPPDRLPSYRSTRVGRGGGVV